MGSLARPDRSWNWAAHDWAELQEMAWRAQAAAGPFQTALRAASEQGLQAVMLEALTPYGTTAGGVHMQNRFRYLTTGPVGNHVTEG